MGSGTVGIGDIVYHAFPFNAEPETMDGTLFQFGLELTHRLVRSRSQMFCFLGRPCNFVLCACLHVQDAQLNVSKKIVMSQRDVPGMTKVRAPPGPPLSPACVSQPAGSVACSR